MKIEEENGVDGEMSKVERIGWGMIIYGWMEQNEPCWGIECREVSGDFTADEYGELYQNGDDKLPEGSWFNSFGAAKRAALQYWNSTVNIARYALREVRRLRCENVLSSLGYKEKNHGETKKENRPTSSSN